MCKDNCMESDFLRKLDEVAPPLSESRPTDVVGVMSKLHGLPGLTPVKVWSIMDGAVGLYRDETGQAYEIQVRPAEYAKYKDMLGTETKDPKKLAQKNWQSVIRKH